MLVLFKITLGIEEMKKHFEISKNGVRLGSILAETIHCDPADNYLLFMLDRQCVAMFPAENIEIADGSFDISKAISDFTEYQSNRV